MSKKKKVEPRLVVPALSKAEGSPDEPCHHIGADGRRCSMAAAPGDSLCLPHRQRQQKDRDAEALAADLLGPFAEFKTATSINYVLGKLFSLVARGRIAPRNAAVLAYIGQLLLNSLGAVRQEAQLARGYDQWQSLLRRTLRNAQREAPPARRDTLAEPEHAEPRPVEVKIVGPAADAAGSPGPERSRGAQWPL